MSSYDPFKFVFDKTVRDTANGVRVDVTVVDAEPEGSLQINLKSGALTIPFFLRPYHARMLARHLLAACDAQDKAVTPNPDPESENFTTEEY